MDIEERAEKWALDNIPHAGSAQTQADYVAHYCP